MQGHLLENTLVTVQIYIWGVRHSADVLRARMWMAGRRGDHQPHEKGRQAGVQVKKMEVKK